MSERNEYKNEISKERKTDDRKRHKPYDKKYMKRNNKSDFNKEYRKHRDEEFKRTDRSHKAYSGDQTLNLNVLEGIDLHAENIPPLAGRNATAKATHIDFFKEKKAIYNSSALSIFQKFRDVDTQNGSDNPTAESMMADYVVLQVNYPTYLQMPHPSYSSATWNGNINTPTNGNNFTSPWTSYNTRRFLVNNNNYVRLQATFSLNESYAQTPALLTKIQAPAQDQNIAWNNASALSGWIDGVNTGMLDLVTTLKTYKVNRYLLRYFGSRHPLFTQYLEYAFIRISLPKIKSYLRQAEDILKQIPCDVEWVDKYSDLNTSVSRTGNSYYDPIFINETSINVPWYQLSLNNGNGMTFTYTPSNSGYTTETTNSPFYISNRNTGGQPLALSLLQQLQSSYADNGLSQSNLQSVTTAWVKTFEQKLQTFVANCTNFFNMSTPLISLYNQAYVSRMTRMSTHNWTSDGDIEFKYDPTLLVPIYHPEFKIQGSVSPSGQYTATIGMKNGRIDETLIDSTRIYSIVTESAYLSTPNSFDNDIANWTPTLAVNDTLSSDGSYPSVFQLPTVFIYSYISTYSYNSTYTQYVASDTEGSVTLGNTTINVPAAWMIYSGNINYSTEQMSAYLGIIMESTNQLYTLSYQALMPVTMSEVSDLLLEYTLTHTAFTNTTDANVQRVTNVVSSYK